MTKCYNITSQLSSTGLKPGQVNWVILIMFCPGQAGLSQLINYLALAWILHWIAYIHYNAT